MGGDGMRPLTSGESLGNMLLRRCASLAAMLDAGSGAQLGQHEAIFDWCRYGRSWRKTTRLAGRGAWLRDLDARCLGGHEHLVLQGGGLTAAAAEYSDEFCSAYAKLATRHAQAAAVSIA